MAMAKLAFKLQALVFAACREVSTPTQLLPSKPLNRNAGKPCPKFTGSEAETAYKE